MKSPLDSMQKRTRRYWYEDGLAELAAGSVISLLALLNLAIARFSPPWQALLSAVVLPLVIIGGAVIARAWVQRLKERLTYPRTGLVIYPRPRPSRRFRAAGVALGVAVTVALLSNLLGAAQAERLLPAVTGLFTALLILLIGIQVGLVRFYFLAAWQTVIGLLGSWLALPQPFDLVLFFGGLGAGFLASGALTLIRYLRNNPLPPAGHEDQP